MPDAPGAPPAKPQPLVAAILEGRAAPPLKLAAARGALPIPRRDLIHVLVHLLEDPGEEVRIQAGGTIATIPEEDLAQVLSDPTTATEVLDHFGATPDAASALRTAVLKNPSTTNETLCRMAPSLTASQIDEILLNQNRLIDAPEVLDLLALNPSSTALQRTRFEEIRRHFLAQPAPSPAPEAPAIEAPPIEGVPEDAPAAEDAVAEEVEEIPEEGIEATEVAATRIQRLTTAEKVKLAFKANREERTILIRDASRSVQTAVLECPMLSEPEVEQFSRMRTMSEDVLRQISEHRVWMKNYKILHALSTNPKTPIRTAMNLLQRLRARDLKAILSDKNLPEALRRHARKVTEAREKRQGRG